MGIKFILIKITATEYQIKFSRHIMAIFNGVMVLIRVHSNTHGNEIFLVKVQWYLDKGGGRPLFPL